MNDFKVGDTVEARDFDPSCDHDETRWVPCTVEKVGAESFTIVAADGSFRRAYPNKTGAVRPIKRDPHRHWRPPPAPLPEPPPGMERRPRPDDDVRAAVVKLANSIRGLALATTESEHLIAWSRISMICQTIVTDLDR